MIQNFHFEPICKVNSINDRVLIIRSLNKMSMLTYTIDLDYVNGKKADFPKSGQEGLSGERTCN